MNEVIAHSFRNILEELKVGKFTEKDLRFIIDTSKEVMEATVIVMRRNMKEDITDQEEIYDRTKR